MSDTPDPDLAARREENDRLAVLLAEEIGRNDDPEAAKGLARALYLIRENRP
jgi:hypothetical protein